MLKTSTFCFLSLLKGRCQSLLLYHPYYLLNANRGTSCWIKMCNCSKSPGRALAMTNRDEKVQLCLRRAINNSYFSPPAHRIFRCIDRHMARLQSTSEELIAEIQSWKTKENRALVPVIYATSKKKTTLFHSHMYPPFHSNALISFLKNQLHQLFTPSGLIWKPEWVSFRNFYTAYENTLQKLYQTAAPTVQLWAPPAFPFRHCLKGAFRPIHLDHHAASQKWWFNECC